MKFIEKFGVIFKKTPFSEFCFKKINVALLQKNDIHRLNQQIPGVLSTTFITFAPHKNDTPLYYAENPPEPVVPPAPDAISGLRSP
ncbi:MAG: hypothetical protein IT269_02600 [Saprospiraceae bacterium]|jgi:hypothetical protein|nr:hypothetical protein [Saprospiraceae bacterium]